MVKSTQGKCDIESARLGFDVLASALKDVKYNSTKTIAKLRERIAELERKLELATRGYEERCEIHPDGVITCDGCARAELEQERNELYGFCSTHGEWASKHPEEFIAWWRKQREDEERGSDGCAHGIPADDHCEECARLEREGLPT